MRVQLRGVLLSVIDVLFVNDRSLRVTFYDF